MMRGRRSVRVMLALSVWLVAARAAAAAVCPFNIPAVSLPPHQVAGFTWGSPIVPLGDPCVTAIAVEPTNGAAWYVAGLNGLYMTKNAGLTWTNPVGGGKANALTLVPGTPQLVYVAIGQRLYLSRDHGLNWNLVRIYPKPVASVLVTPAGRLYVGLAWNNHIQPSGVWASNLGGGGAVFVPFGPGHTGLIVWTLARDPLTDTLYAGTEIFDHPSPYEPPFLRSTDGGLTWQDVSGTLPWHVIAAAVRPTDGFVYALTEGPGLHGSGDLGATWAKLWNGPSPSTSLLMDPNDPLQLFGGRHKFGFVNGGAFRSIDGGLTFQPIGLTGATVGGLAVNGPSTRLYAAVYASGIYTSPIP